MSESTEQSQVVQWFRYQYPGRTIFAIPNGSWLPVSDPRRRIAYAVKRKREGLTAGVSDLFIAVPTLWRNYKKTAHGLFIEMKDVGRTEASAVTPDQIEFIKAVRLAGYKAEVAAGFVMAKPIIEDYMRGAI